MFSDSGSINMADLVLSDGTLINTRRTTYDLHQYLAAPSFVLTKPLAAGIPNT